MTELEDYFPCPVCLGIPLTKLRFRSDTGPTLILDYCKRCHGMWFDKGEVQALQRMKSEQLKVHIPLKESDRLFLCHQCMEPFSRNLEHCPQCRWKNQLACPRCHKKMQIFKHQGLQLDICKPCQGVWFDNFELAQLWNTQFTHFDHKQGHDGYLGDIFLAGLEVATYSPYLTVEVIEASAEVAAAVVQNTPQLAGLAFEAVANLPDAAGAVFEGAAVAAEAVGGAAGSIFEAIADILSGIFS